METTVNKEQTPVNVLSNETIESLANMPHDKTKKDILKEISRTPYERNGIRSQMVAKFFELIYSPVLDEYGNSDMYFELDSRNKYGGFNTIYFGLQKHRFLNAANEILALGAADCVFFGVNPRTNVRKHDELEYEIKATNSYVEQSAVVWIDIDAKKVNPDDTEQGKKEIIPIVKEKLPIQPSIIVGSGNGYHLYYLLDKSYPVSEVSKVCWKMEQYLGIADFCSDASRIMRVPLSVNHKIRRRKKPVTIIKFDEDRFSLADFDFLPNVSKPIPAHHRNVNLSSHNQANLITVGDLQDRITKDDKLIGKLTTESLDEYLETYASKDMKDRTRSGRDFHVVCQLIKEGFEPDEIRDIFNSFPVGNKYRERLEEDGESSANSYMTVTIENAMRAVADGERSALISVKVNRKERY